MGAGTQPQSQRLPLTSIHTCLQIFCLAWSPDGQHLATVCKDGHLRVYAPRAGPEPLQVSKRQWEQPLHLTKGPLLGFMCCIPTGRPRA